MASSVQGAANVVPDPPTEAHPEAGVLILCDVELSQAEHWIEDDHHVIRSVEFDVIAGAPTFDETLAKFLDNLMAYAAYLAEIEVPAENEEEMFHTLAPRVLQAMRRLQRYQVRRRRLLGVSVTLSRRRGDDASRWHPLSKPHSSSLPSLA